MTCRSRSRHLTADGVVLRCDGIHRHLRPRSSPSEELHGDEAAGVWWVSDGTNTWRAPDCEGACSKPGIKGVGDLMSYCPACKGTGVNESVPQSLVGPGSVYRHTHGMQVFYVEDCDDAEGIVAVGLNGESVILTEWIEAGLWTLIRAVPHMHTEETS
jgi:hypothetical protein